MLTPDRIDPGEMATLMWGVVGAEQVELYIGTGAGEWDEPQVLAASGQLLVEGAGPNAVRIFRLVARNAAGVEVEQSMTLKTNCLAEWVFEPNPGGCPSPAIESAAAQQQFQNGFMVWIKEQNRIYVFYYGGTTRTFTDDWTPDEIEYDPEIIPPDGLYQPTRGFGKVWREVNEAQFTLGWALAPESAYTTTVQSTALIRWNSVYLRLIDDRVLVIESDGRWAISE